MDWKIKRHSRLKIKSGDSLAWDTRRGLLRGYIRTRRHRPFEVSTQKTKIDAPHEISYRHFRSQIVLRQRGEDPFASSPLTTERQYSPGLEFDTVCQRLALDSPPGGALKSQLAQDVTEENVQDAVVEVEGGLHCSTVTPPIKPLKLITAGSLPTEGNAPQQDWVWTAARQENNNSATEPIVCGDPRPFTVLNEASMGPLGKPVMTLAAPSLLNDYYTNLLDCSCNGTVALALGSSVYLWNSERQAVEGYLHPRPTAAHTLSQPRGRFHHRRQAISSLGWSRDGRALSIGTWGGEIQLWDVDHGSKVTCLHSHHSVVGALSWKQGILSSGSVLGHIHHYDPRAPTPLLGVAVQQGAVCSLEWSQGGDWLASGSTDGFLSIWDDDTAWMTRPRQPVTTMKQPSAVKAMGWCPWQRQLIATGGGRSDGQLRIWDTQSGTCISSVHTNSQICSLLWSEKKRALITGHGLPHHHITCWAWEPASLSQSYQLAGHSHRVLHLALSPCGTRIVSAGADHYVHIWAM